LGLIPEVGTSWALTRRLGYQGALAFYLRGEHIDADTALRLGLVQQVVAHDELSSAADDWCSRVAEMPPHAIAMAKPLLRSAADASWNDALTLEEFAEPTCFTTAAFADNVDAMLNGRRQRTLR
jgi:2-(1,2-epoxy-1,2-dihydrophenyl)acetyl-CoA isomerase